MEKIRLQTTADPDFFAWVFAEKENGQRITAELIDFDASREDVHINKHGVVLFQTTNLARLLLKMKA